MKVEIEIPSGVEVQIESPRKIIVSGKEGKVEKEFKGWVTLRKEDNKVVLEVPKDRKKMVAELNTVKKIVNNMFSGVQKKYKYKLKVVYSHFPITISLKGKELHINNFTGEKKPRIVKIMDNVDVQVKGKDIIVSSVDKEAAGLVAGLIEQRTRVKNRDQRIYQDGIYIVEKGVQDE